ncbi:MAG: TetR/AcrR family transcriptional regulator [Candidatus Microsaccharimonas sp.]
MNELTIRDRKRQTTATTIHTIAKAMVLEVGLANVLVEDIATKAGVSRRTFFNYFATKDDAILGLQEPTLLPSALEVFKESKDSLLLRTVRLIVTTNSTALVHGASFQPAVALRKQHPELKARFDLCAAKTEQLIRPVIEQYAKKDDVEVLLRLSGAILRYTYANDPKFQDDSIQKSVAKFLETIDRIA